MRKYSAASSTSPSASAKSGLPWSSVSRWPSSSRRFSMASAMRCRRFERSKPFSAAIAERALWAASTARFASARVPFGTWAITSPVAGLVASNSCPLSDSVHLPSTNIFRTERATSMVISLPFNWSPCARPAIRFGLRVKRLLINAAVRGGIDIARIADGLGVVKRLVGEHRNLVLAEAELLHPRDVDVLGQLVDVLDRHLGGPPRRDAAGVKPERHRHAREPLGFAGVVVLHHRSEQARR